MTEGGGKGEPCSGGGAERCCAFGSTLSVPHFRFHTFLSLSVDIYQWEPRGSHFLGHIINVTEG